MALAFIFAAVILFLAAYNDTQGQLGSQLASDFTGAGNFWYWIAALAITGALGAIPGLKPFSRGFMALILLSLFLSNKGVWANLTTALSQSGTTQATGTGASTPTGIAAAESTGPGVTSAQTSPGVSLSPGGAGISFGGLGASIGPGGVSLGFNGNVGGLPIGIGGMF